MNAVALLRDLFRDDVPGRPIRPSDRPFVTSVGLAATLYGLFLWLDHTGDDDVFLPWLWPWWFIVTGVAILVYARWPHSADLHAATAAALSAGIVARAMALCLGTFDTLATDGRPLGWPAFHDVGGWRVAAATVAYLLLGRLLYREWRRLQPVPRRHARDR